MKPGQLLPLLLPFAAALLAAPAAGQYRDPEFRVPWIGYDVSVYPNGIETWASVLGDVNRDGALDLVATSWYANPTLSVLLGDGRGGFLPPTMLPIPLGSLDLELVDHEGDGDLDVYLVDTGQVWEGFTFSVYLNDGFGRFAFGASFGCGQGPSHLAVGDVNGDGVRDVVVAHDAYIVSGTSIAVVLGRAAGGFQGPQIIQLSGGTYDIELDDYDADSDLDLFVGHETNRITVLRNKGEGFDPPVVLTTIPGSALFSWPDLTLADADRDGDRDVFFSGYGLGEPSLGSGAVVLFRNLGGGSLGPVETIPTGPVSEGAVGVSVADVTADGWPDLLTGNYYFGWSLVTGNGTGGFGAPTEFRAGENAFAVRVGDLDRDTDLDVIVVAQQSMEACVHLNPGDGAFWKPTPIDLVPETLAPVSHSNLAVSDIDHDGDFDFVVGYSANFVMQTGISVRRNQGNGTFAAAQLYSTPLFPEDLILADLDGDTFDDVIWVETDFGIGTPRLRYKRNLGNGTFGTTTSLSAYCGQGVGLEALDVDADNDLDILVADCLESVYVHRNIGTGFAARQVHTVGVSPDALGGGDFDGDGFLDIVTNTGVQGYPEISIGNGNGTFQPPYTETAGRGTTEFDVADLDLDGVLDIAAAFLLDGDGASVLLGRGDGTFRPPANYHGTYSGISDDIEATDVDGDGYLDLLTTNHTSQDVSFWRNAGNGQYERLRRWGVSLPSESLFHGDFDGDGLADLAVLTEPDSPSQGWYYPAVVLLEGETAGFRDLGFALAGTHGQPRLDGVGPLVGGQPFSLVVENALEQTSCFHVIGSLRLDVPLLGGQLVPLPEFVIADTTDASGEASLGLTWPPGLPSGATFYAQTWVLDPAGPRGAAATNALEARQP